MTATCIALEGPDGVGKSTVAAAAEELLRKRAPAAYSAVRIRHFPTDALVRCADDGGCRLKAEDYATDMGDWLSLRPEPGTLYILDRWALSTAVYASLRGERIEGSTALALDRLNRVPLTTFVLLPRDPALLTDPDYGADNGTEDDYDPVAVSEAYRRVVECARGSGALIPITVDRARDTPGSVAAGIVERLTAMGAL